MVYVDDIMVTDDDVEEIKYLKERLGKTFEVKDLGPLRTSIYKDKERGCTRA